MKKDKNYIIKETEFIPEFLVYLESRSTKHFYGDQLLQVCGKKVYDSVYKQNNILGNYQMNLIKGITRYVL